MNNILYKNYIFVFPLLILLISINILYPSIPSSDEIRYLSFAENILNGEYASHDRPGFLWNGPGYPIILSILSYFRANYFFIKLFNCFFIFFGSIQLLKSFKYFSIYNVLILFVILMSEPFFYYSSTKILTEALTFFLVASIIRLTMNELRHKMLNRMLLSFSIALLMLTKVLFAYVFLIVILLYGVTCLILKFNFGSISKVILFSYLLCSPYLIYTYNLTGDFFYWSDAGGSALYPMTSLYQNEYGDWFPSGLTSDQKFENKSSKTTIPIPNKIPENHGPFLESLKDLNGFERDKALKEKSLLNIKSSPINYIENIFYNFGRLNFRFPFSNRYVTPLLQIYLILKFSMFLLPFLYSLVNFFRNKRNDKEYFLLIIFLSAYGSTLLFSAESRMLFPLFPFLIWIFLKYYKDKYFDFEFKKVLRR